MVNTAKRAEIEKRRKTVAANLLNGMTISQIAEAMDINVSQISRDFAIIIKVWREDRGKDTEAYVTLENARLDRALNSIWKRVLEGELLAIDRLIKIMDRRAKLLGLDKPAKVELRQVTDVPDDMLDRYADSGDPAEIQKYLIE